jgi:hypothetical protein
MLARSEIHRSLATMTLDLHKMIDRRANAGAIYQLAEREFQAQYDFSGTVGTLPVETEIAIPFSVMFLGDAGLQRDSQLDRPHARLTTELLYAPPGAVPYHYVKQWQLDPDLNYVGAIVTVGMSCPAMFVTGATPPTDLAFKGKLHAAFQGFGLLTDDENSQGLDANPNYALVEMGIG